MKHVSVFKFGSNEIVGPSFKFLHIFSKSVKDNNNIGKFSEKMRQFKICGSLVMN